MNGPSSTTNDVGDDRSSEENQVVKNTSVKDQVSEKSEIVDEKVDGDEPEESPRSSNKSNIDRSTSDEVTSSSQNEPTLSNLTEEDEVQPRATDETSSSENVIAEPSATAIAQTEEEEEEPSSTTQEETEQDQPTPTPRNLEPYLKDLEKYNLEEPLASRLAKLFSTEKLTINDLDNRAIDALKEYGNMEGVIAVLDEFESASLEHVNNKSAYLCGLMKTHRQKEKALKSMKQLGLSIDSSRGSNDGSKGNSIGGGTSSVPPINPTTGTSANQPGPNEANLKAILERTGYTLDVTSGQRKYGGPPPNWEGPTPGAGCEIFVGRIPKEIFEDELIPIFEEVGKIYDLRLMIDPVTGYNRGFAFITYCNKDDASSAQSKLDGHEIRPKKPLKVNVSVPNLRLFVGNIPKSKTRDEIFAEFSKLTTGVLEVIVYSSPDDRKKNRGFCFLEYDSHKSASLAKRKLSTGRVKVWNCDILVDWADPQEEPDQETMSKVKVLYVRNLVAEVSEDEIRSIFEKFGQVDRVKKIKDYAFVHFSVRDDAIRAMNELNESEVKDVKLSVSLAKPPSDRKKKEEMLRNRERRIQLFLQQRAAMNAISHGVVPPPHPPIPHPVLAGHPAAAAAAAGLAAAVAGATGVPTAHHHSTQHAHHLLTPNVAQSSSISGGPQSGGSRGGNNKGGRGSHQVGSQQSTYPMGSTQLPPTNYRSPANYATTPATAPWQFAPTDWLGYGYGPNPTNWMAGWTFPPTDPRSGHPAQTSGIPTTVARPTTTGPYARHPSIPGNPAALAAAQAAAAQAAAAAAIAVHGVGSRGQSGGGGLTNGPHNNLSDNNKRGDKTWSNRNRGQHNNRHNNHNGDQSKSGGHGGGGGTSG